MANQSRRQIPTLREAFEHQAYTFEFDQAVKLLEALEDNTVPLGETFSINSEALTIKSRIYLSAPPSDIYDIRLPSNTNGFKTTIRINFLGVAGIQGPLPIPYTDAILDRLRHKDTTARDFLDIFNHRLASILHRIRKKHWIGLDRSPPYETTVGRDLLSLTGMASGFLKTKTVPPHDLIYYSGLYWQQPRSPIALRQILSHYFNTDSKIYSHQGGWVNVPEEHWTYLGTTNNTLGSTTMMGTKTWDVNQNIQVKLGPLNIDQVRSFLKNGDAYPKLIEMLQLYLPTGYKFSIKLLVKAKDVQATKLDGKSYLGWTSWLLSKPAIQDDEQIRLYPTFETD